MIWRRELLHFARDRTGTAVSLLQPLLFLFVFGAGVAGLLPSSGGPAYQLFLFSGILVMAAQGPAVAVGSSVLWERQNGFLREMLVSPVRRGTLLMGKCLGGTTVATCQAAILLTAATPIGIPLDVGLYALLLVELALTTLAMTAFGVLAATLVGRPQTFGTALTVLMAPLIFLSGAMFPLAAMPTWMATLALVNPLSYAVDGMRRTVAAYLPDPPAPLFQQLAWGHWHPRSSPNGASSPSAPSSACSWPPAASPAPPDLDERSVVEGEAGRPVAASRDGELMRWGEGNAPVGHPRGRGALGALC
ncbi:ABC transporter permease [Actinomadura keratinilytica]|uniref:ABC transporter permease n=1 Tax=Actinomadura keratinilytica TaxID=547461 RepID=UPI00361FA9D7